MLRDERQIALNGAIEACLHAAHVHDDTADQIGEDAAGLRQLAARRRQNAEALAAHLRRLGDLPMEPDPEYEAATSFLSHIKAAFAADEQDVLLERSRAAESALAEALRHALSQDLSPECRSAVQRILGSIATSA
jgi:aminoglycoside phosphotransferase